MKKILIGAAVLASLPAFAADEVGKWYINPNAGYLWTDHDRDLDNDWIYGLGLGKHVSENWSVEFNINSAKLNANPSDVRFTGFSADVLRVFGRENRISPFISLGAGALDMDPRPDPSSTSDFMAQAGLGLMWRFNDTFSLRPEVKARWDDTGATGHQTDYIAQLGFQLSFGGRPAPVQTAPPPPPPPAAETLPAPTPPLPPQDSDGDGVLDPQDQCPGTPHGVAVDAVGCERKGSITLEGVNFELNSAELMVESRPALDRVATDLKKYPRLKIELQGHTDSSGSDAYNLKLSQKRAETVARYLSDAGVPAGQVTPRGYGESEPIADNKSADGRAQNRRVVMKVLENPADVQVKGEGEI